ncbi:CsgG/HfaB family protein [Algoriphagus sp.]|uniref:CsgG/HfaB family protein n=1 Tax=Algoriphagus sp. TaxID=1872435 RepID=UPI00261497F0|nr:CsgG/HfaB family protein [Algoriphagus sp.]
MYYRLNRVGRMLGITLLLISSACSPYYYQPFNNRDARLGPETPMKKELQELPEPKEPIYVAVYKFRDQTGQYKESNVGASWSTAVTQGATNILIRALEESGWFVPIERENISNLLNERKIIRSSREQYEGSNNVLLPPLLFAGVLLEGGIVSYETNVYTGGAGLRYFGADASSQYREDRISIYLRAISTNNGKILKTVYTTKSILSQEVSAGLFRYVKFRRLLEAETGYTYNEPREMAIIEAIEKAVHSLVIEGAIDNLWQFKAESDTTRLAIDSYLAEKEENQQIDYIGRLQDFKGRTSTYLSLMGNTQTYIGDYSSSSFRPGFTANLGIGLSNSLFLEGGIGIQQIEIKELVRSVDYFGDLNLMYFANTKGKLSPYASAGVGSFFDPEDQIGLSGNSWLPYAKYGAGLEYLFSDRVALTSRVYVNHMFNDRYDGVEAGTFNDVIWGLNLGFRFYLGK